MPGLDAANLTTHVSGRVYKTGTVRLSYGCCLLGDVLAIQTHLHGLGQNKHRRCM
jgi:hypothetical protein